MSSGLPRFARSAIDLLRSAWRSDILVRITLVLSVLVAIVPVLPESELEVVRWLRQSFSIFFIAILLVALLWGSSKIVEPREKRFWRNLTFGFAWVAAINVLYQLPQGQGLFSMLVTVASNLAFALFYFHLVLASEDEPHRARAATLEGRFAWPGVALFTFGLVLYFTLLGPFDPPRDRATPLKTLHLLLALEAYLTLRFGILARSTESRRWRMLYALFGLSFGSLWLYHLLRIVEEGAALGPGWSTFRAMFWVVPNVFLALAIRARHLPFDEGPPVVEVEPDPWEQARLPAAAGRTLIFALVFPAVHLLFHNLGMLDPATKSERGTLAFGWMMLLGGVAFAQMHLLGRRAAEIWQERRRFEARLHSSEDDLRLILERRRAEETLQRSEEMFGRIFRSCPDALALTTEAEGRLVDANPGFERITGIVRGEALGQTLGELGIWQHPEGREELIRRLYREGGAIELETNFRNRAGQVRVAHLLLDRVEIDGEACLITIARDVTERRRAEAEQRRQAAMLENAVEPIWAVDAAGRLTFWNRAAEKRYEAAAEEVSGRRPEEFVGGSELEEAWRMSIEAGDGRREGWLSIAPPVGARQAAGN